MLLVAAASTMIIFLYPLSICIAFPQDQLRSAFIRDCETSSIFPKSGSTSLLFQSPEALGNYTNGMYIFSEEEMEANLICLSPLGSPVPTCGGYDIYPTVIRAVLKYDGSAEENETSYDDNNTELSVYPDQMAAAQMLSQYTRNASQYDACVSLVPDVLLPTISMAVQKCASLPIRMLCSDHTLQ